MNSRPLVTKDPWFVEDRAVAFASLLITSRPDLVVQKQTRDDHGIELLVEVQKNGKPTMRYLGVFLKGRTSLPKVGGVDALFTQFRKMARTEFTLPLCAFLIDVKTGQGYSAWVVEPSVDDEKPRLKWHGKFEWEPLTEAGLDQIVGRVTAWYGGLRPAA